MFIRTGRRMTVHRTDTRSYMLCLLTPPLCTPLDRTVHVYTAVRVHTVSVVELVPTSLLLEELVQYMYMYVIDVIV